MGVLTGFVNVRDNVGPEYVDALRVMERELGGYYGTLKEISEDELREAMRMCVRNDE